MSAASRPTLCSALFYREPMTALKWLEKAFGFETVMLITDAEGNLGHSQMSFGNGIIMVGTEWSADHKSPASIQGKNTQTVHVHLDEDVDKHCARAKAAGAEIIQEPDTQFYGDRTYRARDPEGHMWTFAQTVQAVTREEAEKASGLKIEGWV
jgi:uncharacterized glyoxalase superfamily protein PhnB